MQPVPDERDNKPSASGFERVVNCPGSPAMEASALNIAPIIAESKIATQGTIIHEAVTTEDYSELGLTEEKVSDRLKHMESKAVSEWIEEQKLPPANFTTIREDRFWVIHRKQLEPLTSAKVDYALVDKSAKTCLLLDFKTGFKRVTPATGNWQLKVGLVALDQEFGPFEKARVAIAQHRVGEIFDSCDYTRADIDQAYAEIVFYLQRTKDAEAPRQPGHWCQYCRAAGLCPENIAWAMMPLVLTRPLADVGPNSPMMITQKKVIESRVSALSVEALVFIQLRKTSIENVLAAVTARLKSMSIEQLHEYGLDLRKSGELKSVNSISGLWAILSGAGLISEAEFHSICKVGIGDMEKLLVTRLKLKNQCSVEDAEKMLYSLIAPVITKTEKAPSLCGYKPAITDAPASSETTQK